MDIYDAFNETDFKFLSMEEAASDERIADIDGLVEVKSGEETTFKDLSEHKHLHLIYTDSSAVSYTHLDVYKRQINDNL